MSKRISNVPEAKTDFDAARARLRAGDAEAALARCEEALSRHAGDANLLCLAARANLALRRLDKAKQLLDDCVRLFPDFAIAHDVIGDVLFAEGYVTSAVRAYEQCLRLDPTYGSVLPKIERARQLGEAAALTSPGSPKGSAGGLSSQAEMAEAEQFTAAGDHRSAEEIYRKILKQDPNHVEAARLLARIAVDNKQFRDAEVFLRHAIGVAPDYVRLWVDLANVLRELHQPAEALVCAEKVLELAPDISESYVLHGSVIGLSNRHEEAIRSYEKALAISPERPGALCSMAHHLKTIGDQERAVEAYRRCIAVKPDHAEAYWSLANLKTFRFDDAEVAAMQALLAADDLPDDAALQIHNALGLELEARQEFDAAFSHYQGCNRLRRKAERYDPVEMESHFDRIIDTFDSSFMQARGDCGDPDDSPIFVVGLPRSGSTLIEQILASHSQVDGTHELIELSEAVKGLRRTPRRNSSFPDTAKGLSEDEWRDLGQTYLRTTEKYRAGAERFVDKNPNNFTYIGLIRLALPNARIINARRHPLDSCFGTYKQLFASGQPFSYDFTDLGEYYLQYARIMQHWHELVPGFVLDVQYEDVVADLETEVRRLLDFCELPFEESCLSFHETERAVKTASSEQVRKPIYSSSVNLWRNYEQHIGELIEVLEPLLQELPSKDRPQIT